MKYGLKVKQFEFQNYSTKVVELIPLHNYGGWPIQNCPELHDLVITTYSLHIVQRSFSLR